jgi:hypothetical protein
VRIAVEAPASGVGEGARPPEQQARVPTTEYVARELAGEQRPAATERRQGVVDVVGEQHAVVGTGGGQPGPQALQRRAQQLDVGVDERGPQEVGADGERRRGRVALVAVAIARDRLLVAGEHREDAAEHVDVQPHAGRVELGERPVVRDGGAVEHGQPLVGGEHARADVADGTARQRLARQRGGGEPVRPVGGEQDVGKGDDAVVLAVQPDPDVGVRVLFGPPLQTQPLPQDDSEDVAPFGPVAPGHSDDERHRVLCTVRR